MALHADGTPVWKSLAYLDMSDNRIQGTIPPSFFAASATSLSILRLQSNSLTGTIPDSIANAVNLRELWLMDNALEALPDSISQLGELESLFLQVFYRQRVDIFNTYMALVRSYLSNVFFAIEKRFVRFTSLATFDASAMQVREFRR